MRVVTPWLVPVRALARAPVVVVPWSTLFAFARASARVEACDGPWLFARAALRVVTPWLVPAELVRVPALVVAEPPSTLLRFARSMARSAA
jgi:hypothetical protein